MSEQSLLDEWIEINSYSIEYDTGIRTGVTHVIHLLSELTHEPYSEKELGIKDAVEYLKQYAGEYND